MASITVLEKMSALEKWKAELQADGKGALRALLDGTASLGHLSAAEPEDAVAGILGTETAAPDLFAAFDRGCLSLAEDFRATLLQKEGRSFRVELAKLTILVSIIRRLLPSKTVGDFHRRYILWSGFFENFVVDRGLDLRREYFRILALSQDIHADDKPRRLMPHWLSICAESGDAGRYDQSYLRVAMLGLRRLPLGEEFSANEDFALQGLARWAVCQRPREAAFEREWRILEGDFPRDAGFWADHVQAALIAAERELFERTNGRETTFPIAAWWRQDVDLHPTQPAPTRADAAEPPARGQHEAILRDITRPLTGLAPRIQTLMSGHRQYADLTGDVFFLVRTACNVGMRLIQAGSPEERSARGELAIFLASLAFEYDPVNVYAWSLLRDALVAAGRLADAELVGWEAIRRFPEDYQWRTQLALVLTEQMGMGEEAAALLRETIELFPGEIYPRTQLATILADDLNKREEARTILAGAIANGIGNDVTRNLLEKLSRGRLLRRRSEPHARVEDTSHLSLPSADARRQLFLFESGLTTRDALRAFLATSPSDGYTTYIAQRTGQSDLPLKTTFALAFEDALKVADPSVLRALIARVRPVERLIVEQAIAALEGRVVAFPGTSTEFARNQHLQTLEQVLQQQAGSVNGRLVLLRDYAASTLSASVFSLFAA